jgi:ATP:cob(I)alamin adenosyltransferase
MSGIYTRTGDSGETGLYGGSRLPKASDRVEAYGALDEANSAIGLARTSLREDWVVEALRTAQLRLFAVAAEVASDERGRDRLADLVGPDDVVALEHLIDHCMTITGVPHAFVLPGRDPSSASLHVARTAIRRAERRLLALTGPQAVRPDIVHYVNRLSDALFALARVAEFRCDERRVEKIVRDAVANVTDNLSTDRRRTSASSRSTLDLRAAQAMAHAAEEEAERLGIPVVIAVVDAGGQLVLLHRMPDALLGSLDLAIGKAYTSVAFRMSTAALRSQALPEGPLFGINTSNDGRVVVFGGGEPLWDGDCIAGGIGVSGGTVEQDIVIVSSACRVGWEV